MTPENSTIELPTAEEMAKANAVLSALEQEYDEALKARQMEEQLRQMTLDELRRYEVRASDKLREPKPVIAFQGKVIGSEGNLSAVVGEAKSKKSFLCTAIVGDTLSIVQPSNGFTPRLMRVLWIDTEQSLLHVRKIARRLMYLTGWHDPQGEMPHLKLYALREEPPKERMKIVRQAIEAFRPKLVVIDGVADLQYNTNDLEESERIVTELMALSSIYHCHILSVLHTNPNSDKARGHVGSALQRKAETVLYVHKVGQRSVVEPQFCRNEPFDRFAFHIENPIEEGVPVPAELPSEEQQVPLEVAILRDCFGGAVERNVLLSKLRERGCGESMARTRITRAIKRGAMHLDEVTKIVSLPPTAE